MEVTPRVALEVACHEAIVRTAYYDSVGVLTWSVGLTSATGHRVDRYLNNPQPLQHCLDIYVWALINYARQVQDVFKGHRLTEAQFAAALSFHWNTGAIRKSTWVDYFKRGDMKEAERRFKTWNKADGKTNQGLVNRRASESDLLFRGVWANKGTMTEYPVNARNRPDFSRGKVIRVDAEMLNAFRSNSAPVLDAAPQPDAIPAAPTITPPAGAAPAPAETPITQKWVAGLFAAIAAAVAAYLGTRS